MKIGNFILFVFLMLVQICNAADDVVININKGVMKPVSIALSICDSEDTFRDEFVTVVKNDLESTCLFKSIPQAAFMQKFKNVDEKPNFSIWKAINAQYIANIEVRVSGGSVIVAFRLYDVLYGTDVGGIRVSGVMGEWRKIAHMVANSIYERITGDQGYFDTKVLYVAVDRAGREKRHSLSIMDQDGFNNRALTKGNTLVLTPRFSPNGQECAFLAFREKILNGRRIPLSASVYRYNFQTRATALVANFSGMTYAPRYSPDGKMLIFSLSHRGTSAIHTFDLATQEVKRITKGPYIDTSPCYSPDGKYIVFNSDRAGTQQLYIMDASGSNIRRLSCSPGRYATPVWSPRNDWIAFTKFGAGGFYIGVIRPDGSGERMLAAGNLVEGPTWSPNGRVVMFSHKDYSGRDKIYSVDISGYNKHEIKTPKEAIDPDWSAKLK